MWWRWRSTRDTGVVTLVRLTAADDYGVLVNPMIAAGQAHGAIAPRCRPGAAGGMAAYDAQSGQMLAGSFMDYALAARADDLPSFHLEFTGTRLHHQSARA